MRYQRHLAKGEQKRQFIAGAPCPKCRVIDTIQLVQTHEDEWIECTECGHSEKRPQDLPATQQSVDTDTTVGIVKFKQKES